MRYCILDQAVKSCTAVIPRWFRRQEIGSLLGNSPFWNFVPENVCPGTLLQLMPACIGLRGKATIVDLVNLFSFISGDRCVKHWSLHWKLYKICPPIEPEMVISDCVQELPSPPIGPLQVPPGPPWREGRRSPLYPDYIFNAQHPTNFTHPCSIVYINLHYM